MCIIFYLLFSKRVIKLYDEFSTYFLTVKGRDKNFQLISPRPPKGENVSYDSGQVIHLYFTDKLKIKIQRFSAGFLFKTK